MGKKNHQKTDAYTTRKVAEVLGVTQRTVLNWTEDGKLSCWRTVGGHRRFSVSMVLDLAKHINPRSNLHLNKDFSFTVKNEGSNKKIIIIGSIQINLADRQLLEKKSIYFKQDAYSGLIEISHNFYDSIIIYLNPIISNHMVDIINALKKIDLSHSSVLVIKGKKEVSSIIDDHESFVNMEQSQIFHQLLINLYE